MKEWKSDAEPQLGEGMVDSSKLEEWLVREMPPGTVISNPSWWAKRIARQAIYIHAQPDASRDADARDAARWRELNINGALDARGEFLHYVAKDVAIPSIDTERSPEKVTIYKHAVYETRIRWRDGNGGCDTVAKFIDASIAAGRGEVGR